MTNDDDEVKLSLKVMINKENDKVLYAEADSDFAEVLLSFLTMPLGKIVRLMEIYPGVDKVPVFGSLTALFHSLEDMKLACFSTTVSWWMLYDPPSSFSDECCKLKINVDKSMPARKFFICMGCSRKRTPLVSMYRCVHDCDCPPYMNKQLCMAGPENEDDGVFIKKGLSFLITDDFRMMPVVPGSILQTLLNLGVTITEGAQLRTISLGFNDIMELLRASFQSSTPLSDLLFHRKTKNNDMCDVREHLIPDVSSSDSMNMIVKACVRTTNDSRNNLYVLEAGGDFVDFLFSLLVIPLGGVEWLLGGDSGLRRIDNLYRSVQDFIDNDCFRESNMKRRLMKPKLPPYCLSKNQMFPLKEEAKPKLCFVEKVADGDSNTTDEIISSRLQFKDPKGGESYVKSSAPFFVDRNLYVYDFCEADVDHLKSDPSYKKLELHIGLKEALVILKASLTSDSAIKESLENLIFMKLGFIEVLPLRVMVNRENNKVLFAEADSDFADVLLSFLTLPLGKVVQLMERHYGYKGPAIGSLTSMYESLAELDEGHFSTEGAKQMLLDPESSFRDECSKLKINVDYDSELPAMKYFRCGNRDCSRKGSPLISMYHGMLRCDCGEYMNKPMGIGGPENGDDGDSGVFLKKGLSFLITDDLRMAPVVPGCMIQTLLKLGVTIPDGARLSILAFGLNEIMNLLRASLQSSTPLTDVFDQYLVGVDNVIWNYLGDTLPMEESSTCYSKKMIVKAWVHGFGNLKNKLYLLQAGEDFVDFLLSLLVIPLGGVEWILGGDTGLRSIDNLYRSLRDCIDDKCFRMSEMRSRLMKPKLPPNCLSKNQLMFALEEDVNPKVCYYTAEETSSWMHFKDPKGGESYVKSSATFVVGNGLAVSNESCDIIKVIRRNTLHYKEVELHIGSKEAFNILKKSLTCRSALMDSLANLISEKLAT